MSNINIINFFSCQFITFFWAKKYTIVLSSIIQKWIDFHLTTLQLQQSVPQAREYSWHFKAFVQASSVCVCVCVCVCVWHFVCVCVCR